MEGVVVPGWMEGGRVVVSTSEARARPIRRETSHSRVPWQWILVPKRQVLWRITPRPVLLMEDRAAEH